MSLNLDFKVQKEQKVREIEDSLQNYLPKQKGYQKIIMEAMGYSLLAGGKRLRPMLMKETYTLFGGQSKVIEPFMAAIEMVHTYSHLYMMTFRQWIMMNIEEGVRRRMLYTEKTWRFWRETLC